VNDLQNPLPAAYSASQCSNCVHKKEIRNQRGSRFWLCLKSREVPAWPKYPRQPVKQCRYVEEENPLT